MTEVTFPDIGVSEMFLVRRIINAMSVRYFPNATIKEVIRKSERPYDIYFTITSDTGDMSGWLPLSGINWLTQWTSRYIADMTDYPDMTYNGDWSGVRDSDREKIWAIFNRFVLMKGM